MLQPLLEESNDVVVVERVVDEPSFAPRTYEPVIAQQAKLVRHGGLAQADVGGDVRDAHFRARERVENANTGEVAEHTEGVGERGRRRRREGKASDTHRLICTYEQSCMY